MWIYDKNEDYNLAAPNPTANDLFKNMRKMCDEYDRLKKVEKAFKNTCFSLSKHLTINEDKTPMSTEDWIKVFLKDE